MLSLTSERSQANSNIRRKEEGVCQLDWTEGVGS